MISTIRAPLAIALAAISSTAAAQPYEATVDQGASSAQIDASSALDAPGVLIGDYDPDTNPDGTQTRPGLFGGSGNQPIDTTVVIGSQTVLDASPTGALVVTPDVDSGTIEFDGLELDLLGGQTAATELSVTLGYQTFRTVDPSFLYLGGVPITVPLGEVGSISVARLTQTGPGAGMLAATADVDVYDFTALLPAELSLTISFAPPGGDATEIPVEALPVALPLTGQLVFTGDEEIRLTIVADPEPIMAEIPVDDVVLPEIPFELPTLGDETAGVVLTLIPTLLTLDASLGLSITVGGTLGSCAADLNGDGNLDFFDVSQFLNGFTVMDPAADFNGDGNFDFFDVSAFLNAFTAGCP